MENINEPEPLTSHVRPPTDAVITIRVIKSFPYRNIKNHVLPSINLKETTPSQLLDLMNKMIKEQGVFRPYRNITYNTLKIYTKAHGTKSMDLAINFENDKDWVLICNDASNQTSGNNISLYDLGVENETEISMFNWSDYLEYKHNPEEKW